MPLARGITTWFALNASNDTSPSGVSDIITGQPIYIPDLDTGVYFDVTGAEAAQFSYTTTGTLYAGRYRRVQVDSGATAANVKTGTIGLLASLAAQNIDGAKTPSMNVVTSYDQAIGVSTNVRPVVFLNTVTPGNYCFVQELGVATVLAKSGLTNASPAIGDLIVVGASGLVDDPTQSTTLTYALQKQIIGEAIDIPVTNAKFRVLLNLPVVQD